MSLNCNFSESDDNCSSLFEGVPVSITALQACFAAAIFIVSVPMNILMIVAMIAYHRLLDKAFIISISFLVSNTLIAVFYSSQVFVTSIIREWVFGYWGCQLLAFFSSVGRLSRWITVGLLSVNQFCKVFFPFSHPGKILAAILVSSWVFSLISVIVLHFGNGIGFDISHPGCSLTINVSQSRAYFVPFMILLLCFIIAGTILPSILYTAMYLKARSLRRVQPIQKSSSTHPKTPETRWRSNRANVTYCLLLLSFFIFVIMVSSRLVLSLFFTRSGVSRALSVAVYFLVTNLSQSYLIADLGILLINKDQRKVLWKLIGRFLKLFSCGKQKM